MALAGSRNTEMRLAAGTSSRKTLSRRTVCSAGRKIPVKLPPGLARLATSPSLTGSWATVNTMGIVLVSALAANAGVEPPSGTITATGRRTNSAASTDNRSILLSAQRYSIAAFSPSMMPASPRP